MRKEKCTKGRKDIYWKEGNIPDVVIAKLGVFEDDRGWLSEIFRSDETNKDVMPVMSYLSCTKPGVIRGPHEHIHQTDTFVFIAGKWMVRLWDARKDSKTFGTKKTVDVEFPVKVVVPPGVVHSYANISSKGGLVLNFPNKLYRGKNKAESPDEIRHEGSETYCVKDLIPWWRGGWGNEFVC